MKDQSTKNLKHELRLAGASAKESNELALLASNLKRLKSPAPAHQSWTRLIPIGIGSLAGVAVGMALVILSQTVLPSSALYPVQRLSDSVAMKVDPNYKGTVMMKRAEQVQQLIADHAKSSLVLATLADYRTEASSYKSIASNYAAFEYCKNNLVQAAAIAPSSERQAINMTLSSIKNV